MKISLKEYAQKKEVSWLTAYRWFKANKIPNAEQLPSGRIVIHEEETKPEYTVIYVRVNSTTKSIEKFNSKIEKIKEFCEINNWEVNEVIKEVGSGLSESRNKLQRLLVNDKVTRIVIQDKDQLTRFGYSYIETLLKNKGVQIISINNESNNKEELKGDFRTIIELFCKRIYGEELGKEKELKIRQELRRKNDY